MGFYIETGKPDGEGPTFYVEVDGSALVVGNIARVEDTVAVPDNEVLISTSKEELLELANSIKEQLES